MTVGHGFTWGNNFILWAWFQAWVWCTIQLSCQQRAEPTTPRFKMTRTNEHRILEVVPLITLQLLLCNYHSLIILPFHYCLSTNVLSYSLFTHFCSLSWFVFTCLSLSLSPLLFNRFIFPLCLPIQNLWGHGWAADVRSTGQACCCSMDLHKDTNLCDQWSYVHSLFAGGCK